jgi:ABC-type branched-subunit amino acid transport system ATPase component
MLEVQGLKKAYGSLIAVDGISFQVSKGETIGLLGPTTTFFLNALKPARQITSLQETNVIFLNDGRRPR